MLGDMENIAKMFQEELIRMKEKLKSTRFIGESSDGKVIITVNGLEEVTDINFYLDELDPEIKKNLEHSVLEAVNRALMKVKLNLKDKFTDASGFGGI